MLKDKHDAVGRIHRAPVHLEDASGERMPYLLRGFDEGFSSHGGLPLYAWDEGLGEMEKEAWNSIKRAILHFFLINFFFCRYF